MTLKPIDIAFVCALSLIFGVGGAKIGLQYFAPPPPEPPAPQKIAVFNSGKFVIEELNAQIMNTGQTDNSAVLLKSGRFVDQLASEGYLVISADAVLAAPPEFYHDLAPTPVLRQPVPGAPVSPTPSAP